MIAGPLPDRWGSATKRKRVHVGGLRLDALALCVGYRALVGLLAALPLSAAAASLAGHHPAGDAVLWEPGGIWLVETLRLARPALRTMAPYGALLLLVGAFGWLLPLGALVIAVGSGSRGWPWRDLLGRAAARFPPLALLLGATLLLQVVVLALASVSANLLASSADSSTHGADALRIVGPCLGLALAWLVAVVQDILRVPVLQRGQSLFVAAGTGWELLRTGLGPVLLAAGWRTALAGLTLGVAGAAGARLTGGATDQMTGVALLHLLALAAFVWLRGSWFWWLSRRLGVRSKRTERDLSGAPSPRPAAEPAADSSTG